MEIDAADIAVWCCVDGVSPSGLVREMCVGDGGYCGSADG